MFLKHSIYTAFISLLSSFASTVIAQDAPIAPFGYKKIYAGLQGGWGKAFSLGIAGNGDGRHVEYAAVLPQLGVGLSNIVGNYAWYRGNLDALFQGELLFANQPNSGYSAGISFLLRYNFLFSKQWVPYVELGGGVGTLDFDLRDQDDGLIFYPQAGLGMHYFVQDTVSIDLGWRFHHMSNANISRPNNSINASLLTLGVSWYFE